MTAPLPGQTYASAARSIALHIEDVTHDPDGFYLVHACHPADKGDMSAPGFELTPDEWERLTAQHGLSLQT